MKRKEIIDLIDEVGAKTFVTCGSMKLLNKKSGAEVEVDMPAVFSVVRGTSPGSTLFSMAGLTLRRTPQSTCKTCSNTSALQSRSTSPTMTRTSGQGQLSLDFGEPPMPTPGACEFEQKTFNTKSCCLFRGREIWTNCREWEHCIWDGWHQHGQPCAECDEEDC